MVNENSKIEPFEEQVEEDAQQKKRAALARDEALKKKAQLPKPKYYYDVKVECMLPATLTYRVYAETPQQAADMIKGISPTMVKHRLIGRKELKLMVYDAGSNFMKFMKNMLGG